MNQWRWIEFFECVKLRAYWHEVSDNATISNSAMVLSIDNFTSDDNLHTAYFYWSTSRKLLDRLSLTQTQQQKMSDSQKTLQTLSDSYQKLQSGSFLFPNLDTIKYLPSQAANPFMSRASKQHWQPPKASIPISRESKCSKSCVTSHFSFLVSRIHRDLPAEGGILTVPHQTAGIWLSSLLGAHLQTCRACAIEARPQRSCAYRQWESRVHREGNVCWWTSPPSLSIYLSFSDKDSLWCWGCIIHETITWRMLAWVASRKRVETQIKEMQQRSERTKMEVRSSAWSVLSVFHFWRFLFLGAGGDIMRTTEFTSILSTADY